MANAISGHLQCMDERPRRLQNQPAPSHSGTPSRHVAWPSVTLLTFGDDVVNTVTVGSHDLLFSWGLANMLRSKFLALSESVSSDLLKFSNAAFAARLLTSDPERLKALGPFCDNAVKERNTLCAAVEKEVEKLLPHGKAQKKTVARALGMSTRTFSRRLAVEETTYEEVVDQLRRSLALQYLKDPGMSLSQISWLLGYECSSSFSHAFRRWTGNSPSLARKGKPLCCGR